jgi:hypothetical protein
MANAKAEIAKTSDKPIAIIMILPFSVSVCASTDLQRSQGSHVYNSLS